MPKKTTIVIHHFASHWGNLRHCRDWHVNGNGWRDCGYHWIVNNGYPDYADYAKQKRRADWDGKIEQARMPETSVAAGVAPSQHPTRNSDGIHVSLVGNFDTYQPTEKQMAATIKLCAEICKRHDISPDNIFYHENFANKSCPGKRFVARGTFRQMVKDVLAGKDVAPVTFVINSPSGSHVVNGAFKEKGRWYAPAGAVSKAIGVKPDSPDTVVEVRAWLEKFGWSIPADGITDRIESRNRFDIRIRAEKS